MSSVECRLCGSAKVVPRTTVKAEGLVVHPSHRLVVAVQGRRGGILDGQEATREMTASVCAECGHVELFAEDPEYLYEVYRNSAA